VKRQSTVWLCLLLILSGCTISENGITIPVPKFLRTDVVTPTDPKVVVDPNKPNVVTPDNGQFTRDGMRVLIIEDQDVTEDAARQSMIDGKKYRDFLKDHCLKDSKGNPEFRIVDKKADLNGVWADLEVKGKPSSYPWVILENGKNLLSRELPHDPAEWLGLLEKYAGVN